MAISTTAQLNYNINYTQIDTLNSSRVQDLAQTGFISNLSSNNTGTGNPNQTGVVTLVYNTQVAIAAGAVYQLDLMNLNRNLLNGNITLSLGTGYLSAMFLNNLSNTTGAGGSRLYSDVILRATGSNPFTGFWSGGSGNNIIKAGNCFMAQSVISGFPVTSSQRYLYLIDGGLGTNVDILILGKARTGT